MRKRIIDLIPYFRHFYEKLYVIFVTFCPRVVVHYIWRKEERALNTPLYLKTLHCRLEKDNQVAVRGMVTNRAGFPAPPCRLSISAHDRQDRVVARANVPLPAILPYETAPFEARLRLREESFFTVQCRLEKIKDVDYSDFNFSLHAWSGKGKDQ